MLSSLLSSLYYYPLLFSFLISVGIILMLIILGRFNLLRRLNLRRRSNRHIHGPNISRLGGLAVIAGFWLVIFNDANLVFSSPLWYLFWGSIAIFFFGIWDDFRELDWKIQLTFQIILAAFIYFGGVRADHIGGIISLQNFWLGLIFTIGWIAVSINSMNWLDGVDGASGGVAFLGAVTISLLALKPEVNQPPVAIIALALAGAILGFLIFNFHSGKIMAGTSGSMFFGFMLGALAIFAGAKVATALLVMAVPLVDFIWVIGERWKAGGSIFEPDRRHLHHKLLRLGWSPNRIVLFFYAITLGMAILALNTRLIGKSITIAAAFILITAMMIVVNKKLADQK